MLQQARFDFTQFDTQAMQFHLMVNAPGVFDYAIVAITRQVAGAVQAFAFYERVGDETLGGQHRTTVITARQADTPQVQLAQHADRGGLEVVVEDVAAEVGNRTANRYGVTALFNAGPVSHVDGGFGRAIEVVERGLRKFGEDLLLRIHR
ncbi:hypothetical protein FX985_06441 [Pseudomonas extremaustralis]|uniref:Uncharacterized protein n=1 Tax=Pseudomonas extremaustralis TaxID=359110 RepID=A0A5M9IN76_9PSED|nr:hypothetical protein FX985_06441 [Pseudomonas extremaustralis]